MSCRRCRVSSEGLGPRTRVSQLPDPHTAHPLLASVCFSCFVGCAGSAWVPLWCTWVSLASAACARSGRVRCPVVCTLTGGSMPSGPHVGSRVSSGCEPGSQRPVCEQIRRRIGLSTGACQTGTATQNPKCAAWRLVPRGCSCRPTSGLRGAPGFTSLAACRVRPPEDLRALTPGLTCTPPVASSEGCRGVAPSGGEQPVTLATCLCFLVRLRSWQRNL